MHPNKLADKGNRVGAVVRELASRQCGPESIPALYHVWVEYVVGSRLAPRIFLPKFSGCTPSTKTSISKFQFDQDKADVCKPDNADVASSLNIVIYLLVAAYSWCRSCYVTSLLAFSNSFTQCTGVVR